MKILDATRPAALQMSVREAPFAKPQEDSTLLIECAPVLISLTKYFRHYFHHKYIFADENETKTKKEVTDED